MVSKSRFGGPPGDARLDAFLAWKASGICHDQAIEGGMNMVRIGIATLALLTVGLAALAQDTTGPSDNARFTFYRVGEIFLRFDVQTGRVSECSSLANGWTCKVAPDERTTLETEIDQLTTSNLALKKELLAHGFALPEGIKPDPQPDKNLVGKPRMPAFGLKPIATFVSDAWRLMVAVVAHLQRDMLRKG